MPDNDLSEVYQHFMQDLDWGAEATGNPQREQFFQFFADAASENGDSIDLTYAAVRTEGRGAYQIDGYALDSERGELFLATCDLRIENELQSLNTSHLEAHFRRVGVFVERAADAQFVSDLEETSSTFEVAHLILENLARIRRIRVIVFSNATLATRKKEVSAGTVLDRAITYNVMDFSRYVDIDRARGAVEPIEVDIAAIYGQALPCLEAHVKGGAYESYLVAMPGPLLSEIYGLYGARLLEQNVRVFLQARTKVNRGIIDTVNESPGMFFAYNNGLTATASAVELETLPSGMRGIRVVRDLQIVNGGQTTASVMYAQDHDKADLSNVFIQMKLSVVDPDYVEEIVPKISRWANTQNRVSEADFFASHPFHVEMEKISRRLLAPAKPGALTSTKWFYERARGQYKDGCARGSKSDQRVFQAEFPKDQVVTKTDLAKYESTFSCEPSVVSKGAQKCFLALATDISGKWSDSRASFGEGYFRQLVAKAIVFRSVDRLVGQADWYKSDRGYKANIVTYAIAWLVNHLRQVGRGALDLEAIWKRQESPEELDHAIMIVAHAVSEKLKSPPEGVRNISEYAKQPACWTAVSRLEVVVGEDLDRYLISGTEVKQKKKDDARASSLDLELDFETKILSLAPLAPEIRERAKQRKFLSPKSDQALAKLEKGEALSLTQSDKNALKNLLSRLEKEGLRFLQ